jgi:hypothetical protein
MRQPHAWGGCANRRHRPDTNVSLGQLVSTMVPLTMVDDSTRRVRAFVDESDISTICLGQRARVSADAAPGIQMDGIVEDIGATVARDPFARDASRQFRQVMLSISGDRQQAPIGLQVSVQFSPCVAGQCSPGK